MDIFVIDFLKDFCHAKFISKTLLLRDYVQVQPHFTGATKIKLLHSFRRGELRFRSTSSDSPVRHWLEKYVNYFFFLPRRLLVN